MVPVIPFWETYKFLSLVSRVSSDGMLPKISFSTVREMGEIKKGQTQSISGYVTSIPKGEELTQVEF